MYERMTLDEFYGSAGPRVLAAAGMVECRPTHAHRDPGTGTYFLEYLAGHGSPVDLNVYVDDPVEPPTRARTRTD